MTPPPENSGTICAPLFPRSSDPSELRRAQNELARFCDRQVSWNRELFGKVSVLGQESASYEKRFDRVELLLETLAGDLRVQRAERRRDRWWMAGFVSVVAALSQALPWLMQ